MILVGLVSTAQAQLQVYEPFNYPVGTNVNGLTPANGAFGFSGNWSAVSTVTANDFLTEGPASNTIWNGSLVSIPSQGNFAGSPATPGLNGQNGNNPDHLYAACQLASSVTSTFTAGNTTWISYAACTNFNANGNYYGPAFALGSGTLCEPNYALEINTGDAIGIGLTDNSTGTGVGHYIGAAYWNSGGVNNKSSNTQFPTTSTPDIYVAEINWGTQGGTLSVAAFPDGTALSQAGFVTAVSNSATGSTRTFTLSDASDAALNYVSWGGARYNVDELRIAQDFSDAIGVGNYWAPGAGGGGTGKWSLTGTNWSASASTQGTGRQDTTQALLFQGSAGTVAIDCSGGQVAAPGGLTFGTDGYFVVGKTSTDSLSLSGSSAAANTLTVNTGTTIMNVLLTGSNGMTKSGGGTLVLGNPANSYAGGTTISGGGVLQFAKPSAMPSAGTVSVTVGATLAINVGGTGEFTSGTSGAGSIGGLLAGIGGQGGAVTWSGASLGIDTSNAGGGVTYSGVIGDPGGGLGLAKLGGNSLTITANNVYSGNTVVSNGTLQMPSGQLQSTSIFVDVGTFTQSGGANNVTSYSAGVFVGSGGLYNLSGSGLLTAYQETVGYSSNGTFTQSGGTNNVVGFTFDTQVGLNVGMAGPALYNLSGSGYLNAHIEFLGASSSGTLAQSGGNNATSNLDLGYGGPGLYILSGGSLTASSEGVGNNGSSGTFTQNGGTNNVLSVLFASLTVGDGGPGLYILSGSGLLTSPNETVGASGSSGTLTQSGGTNNVATIELGPINSGSGIYNLNGGLLLVGSGGITQGTGSAAFNFGGGTLGATAPWSSPLSITLTGSGGNATVDTTGGDIGLAGLLSGSGGLNKTGPGTLTLSAANTYSGDTAVSGGTLQLPSGQLKSGNVLVGSGGTGTMLQSGGTNAVTSNLNVGQDTAGSYKLSGGLVIAPTELVGTYGSGSFTQTGGTNSATSILVVGFDSPSPGSYNLSGGFLTAFNEQVGYYTNGSFSQSGGANVLTGTLIVSNSSSYDLSGGLLRLNGLSQGSGSASFNFGGGTLQAETGFSSSFPMQLSGSGARTFDTNGNTLTLSGVLSGSGGLQKIGAGTLVLDGTSSYSGGTTVLAGILVVDSASALAKGSSLTVGEGASLLFATPLPEATLSAMPATGVAVPEPATFMLLAIAAIAGLGVRWRRMSAREPFLGRKP